MDQYFILPSQKFSQCIMLVEMNHVQSHKKKKYPCVECPLSFNNHKNLKRHSLVHTTQKSFHCGLCDKSFKVSLTIVVTY